jgi:hypothetical protein
MAQRKLKIALSSSLADPAAIASIWLDNRIVQANLAVTNNINSPYILEHTFEATGIHTLKIAMTNDFYDGVKDLNLIVNYVALSLEDGSYAPYTYLVKSLLSNNRTSDNAHLMLETIWNSRESLELTIDTTNPVTWFDSYQHTVDNPPPPENPIV